MTQNNPNPNPQQPQQPQQQWPQQPQPQPQQNPNTVYQGQQTPLPPAGFKREEELKQRTDNLNQAADQYKDTAIGVDPSKMEVDREIRFQLDHNALDVPHGDHKNFVYRWVPSAQSAHEPDLAVQKEMAKNISYVNQAGHRVREPAWEIVRGDMPEAKGLHRDALNNVRLGDVILMRCKRWIHEEIEKESRKVRMRRYYGLDSNMIEAAEKARRQGYPGAQAGYNAYNRHYNNANQDLQKVQSPADLEKALREGTVPGLEFNRR